MIACKFIIFFKNYFLERVKLTNGRTDEQTSGQADKRTSGRADERMDGGKATSAIVLSLCRFVVSSLCRFVVWVLWVLKGSKGFYGAILAGRALNSKSPTPSNSLNPSDSLTPLTPSKDNKQKSARPKPSALIYQSTNSLVKKTTDNFVAYVSTSACAVS